MYLLFAATLAFGSFSPPKALAAISITGTVLAPDGTFRIGGLLTDTYVLEAFPPMGTAALAAATPMTFSVTDVGATLPVGDIRLTLLSVSGTVLGPDGVSPVAGGLGGGSRR